MTRQGKQGSQGRKRQQLAWFVGLWLAGVATLIAVASVLRWLMGI